jgi:hypothetical protein
MCSEYEAEFREFTGEVHPLEAVRSLITYFPRMRIELTPYREIMIEEE